MKEENLDEARHPGPWRDLTVYLSTLEAEEREAVSHQTGTLVSQDPDATWESLRGSGEMDGLEGSASEFIALVGVRIALQGGDFNHDLARGIGEVSVQLSESVGERQLAHACLAQTEFKFRKDPESLAAFEEHCSQAIDLGHTGTFCYERLSVLYEYRGDIERATEVCRRAESVLLDSGDARSAERFREKAESIGRRSGKKHG